MNDVIIVLPGIMGSTLRRGDSPVWEATAGAVVEAVTSLFRSVTALRLEDGIGDEHPGDGIEPGTLMPDLRLPFGLWTFDFGYNALLEFLRSTFELVENPPGQPADRAANLVCFPYDWRLSNRYNGQRLQCVAESALQRWREHGAGRFVEARLIFVAHSMGGLVARWYIDHLGGSEVTRKLITLGTPHRGALNALEQLCNGVRKGPGPFKLNLTRFARSLPSLHQLLPEYPCIEHNGGLARTTEVHLPELADDMVRDAMEFHRQIDAGRERLQASGTPSPYQLHPIMGYNQPTFTSARLDARKIVAVRTIGGKDERGDATVPRLSGAPPDVDPGSAIIRPVADNHGGLVHNRTIFDEIEGTLTPVVWRRGREIHLAVETEEVLDPGEPLSVRVELSGNDRVALEALVTDSHGRRLHPIRLPLGRPMTPKRPGPTCLAPASTG
jgi:pimeloyl-ACP methyl ester carboxylesterase